MDEKKSLKEIRAELDGKQLYVVPYMHPDWAWCHTREWHARRYVAVFEDVIALMRKDIGYKWYMDCFCTEIAPLLDRRPELVPELRSYVARGDIQIAGNFANVRPNMVGDEAYVRNMILGRKCFHEIFPEAEMIVYGDAVDVALGHPQIPQLISKGGYRYYRAGRPYEVLEKKGMKREFFWEGLDGTRVLVWWGEYGGIWQPDRVKDLQDKLDDWDELVRTLYETEFGTYLRSMSGNVMWMPQGCDDVLPLKAFNSNLDVPLPQIIRRWNEREHSRMCFAGPNDFFRALEQEADRIGVHRGTVEICDVPYNVGWGGEQGLLAKRLAGSEAITSAETWMLAAQLAGISKSSDLTDIWKKNLNASCHATAWLFTEDFDEISAMAEKAILDADEIKKEALRKLVRNMPRQDGCIGVAFNSLEFEREAVLELTLPSGIPDGLSFVDGEGKTLPYQILKAYEYTDSVWEYRVLVQVKLPPFGWTAICARNVKTDCRLGGAFTRASKPKPFGTARGFEIDNGVIRLEFRNGRVERIFDRETGKYREASSEACWNELVFTGIDTDHGDLHAGPVTHENRVQFTQATILENGPIRWRVKLEGSDGRIGYVQEIMLEAGSRDILFRADFDWPRTKGRLVARIPTMPDCELRGGIPFGSERKDVDAEPYNDGQWSDLHRQWKGLFCAKDYVRAVSGGTAEALLNVHTDRYYLFDRQACTLSYVLINSATLIEDTWEDSVNTKNIEGTGRHSIRWGLRIGAACEPDRAAADAARKLRMPADVMMPCMSAETPNLAAQDAMLHIEPQNLRCTAYYAEGEDAILRLYETDGNPVRARLLFHKPITLCRSENFLGETDDREMTVSGREAAFEVAPHEIVTLRLRFAE